MADSVCALDSVGALRSVPSALLFLFFSFFFFYARYLHKFDFPLPLFLSFFSAEFHRYLSAGQSSCSKRRKAMMHFRFLRVPKESMELRSSCRPARPCAFEQILLSVLSDETLPFLPPFAAAVTDVDIYLSNQYCQTPRPSMSPLKYQASMYLRQAVDSFPTSTNLLGFHICGIIANRTTPSNGGSCLATPG
jgi:hypothetical protein